MIIYYQGVGVGIGRLISQFEIVALYLMMKSILPSSGDIFFQVVCRLHANQYGAVFAFCASVAS